ncbi:SURF1 family protein [Gilvimarinus sp. F26214L]|uniref:SURF1 family protein n=1 Tax=Gilvimarinus sp. DZF01 TaxID=3461371 RepID=UPI004046302F
MKLSLGLNRRITLLTVCLLPVLLWLGNWQLQRAEEKRVIEERFAARQQEPPRPVSELDPTADLAFVRVTLSGRVDTKHQFLLDNRMHAGQVGYEVLVPVETSGGRWVIINRGWLKANPDRRELPALAGLPRELQTSGSVYVPDGEPFLLAEQSIKPDVWPQVIQAVEMDKFEQALQRELFPYVVRLDSGAPGALVTEWQAINQQPEKHVAYAVQWFTMAAALVVWFVFANTNLLQLIRSRS